MIKNSGFLDHELFSQAFEYAPIGMALISTSGQWLHVNSFLCQILGYSKSEFINLSFQDITHPEDKSICLEVWNRFLQDDIESIQLEKRYIHKNGFTVWALLALSVVRDEHRNPLFFIAHINDLTENKLSEEELETKTEPFESFIQHNADAIWMVDLDDMIIKVNPTFETMFGWTADEIVGKKIPIIPDLFKDSMDEIHQRIKKGETLVSLETIRRKKDGQLLDVEATLSPIQNGKGTIIGITGICRDISRRKLAEEELKAKTEQLESFIENNADAIWMVDLNDMVLQVNPTFETLFGWTAEEIKGTKLPIIPEFQKESMETIHQRIKTGQSVISLQTIRQRKDGGLLDVEATLSPIRDRRGTIIGITGICRDVTRRKRAEEELRSKTTQLESFIENNTDAILIFDQSGVVQRANRTFEKIFGWKKEEIIGMDVSELPCIPAEYMEESNQLKEQVKQGHASLNVETIRKRKNGELLNVFISISPILDGKGKNDGWSVTIRDITEWKNTQEHLQNSEKLSVAGQLAAGIAHEIRNPMTAIKGFVHLMKAGFGEKQKYFDIMSSEIERIEMILSELLILAKPQSIKYERKDIRVLLSQVMTLLDTQAILNNVQFVTEYKPGATHIYCDENQIKQVFINFIKNSIESMPEGGKIIIEIHCDQNQEIQIRITDQGCGIPKQVLSKLGQPFYTTKEKGTGLGFMVSKQIIENHFGQIHVQSEVYKGTTIEVRLPIICS